MGKIISVRCACGYGLDRMLLGGGMLNFATFCGFPCFCQDCKSLFLANVFNAPLMCPECSKDNVVLYDDETICQSEGEQVFSWNMHNKIGRKLVLTDGQYLCPSCGEYNLSFSYDGEWD